MQNNKVNNIWVTVAFRTGMHVYNYDPFNPKPKLALIHTLEHPEGSLKDSELTSDHPGRSFDSLGGGRHSLGTKQSPSQHVSEVFAKDIAKLLDEGRNANQYSKLILVAGPTFLGILRQNINPQTALHIVHTLNKDLVNLSDPELKKYLEKNIKNFLTKD